MGTFASSRRWPRVIVVLLAVAGFTVVGARAASASAVPDYELSLFAGVAGTSGSAASGEFEDTLGVAASTSGDLYVTNYYGGTVDEVTPSGHISVFAGGGSTTPSPGQTISATAANLDDPYSVAIGSSGDVYIADEANGEVEEVTPSGELSVIAGGGSTTPTVGTPMAATDADLQPFGVAVDSSGDVYLSDRLANEVDEVTPSGELSVIAGTGTQGQSADGLATSEKINFPGQIAVNSTGDVYVTSYGSGQLDEITPGGELTVLAGTGIGGHPSDGPAATSKLDGPWGVALDGAGDIYVTDYADGDVSEITPDGQLSVIAGDGTAGTPTYGVPATTTGLDYPEAIASTPAGRLYVADYSYSTIDLLSPGLPAITVAPSVSGTVALGSTLTAIVGSWTNVPILYTYQWQDCDTSGANCVDISGATSATYTLSSSDEGHTVRVIVTAANGAGSVSADSPATSELPSPATTAGTTTTTPTVGGGAASGITGVSAILGGTVGSHTDAITYEFQYGTSTSYGKLTAGASLAASNGTQSVEATVRSLIPGMTYHYRLVVIGSDATVTYGPDQTFTTPKVKPVRVLDHTHDYWRAHSPYHYLVKGHLKLVAGLSTTVACRVGGNAVITVTNVNGATIAQHRAKLTRHCTYQSAFTLTHKQLPGTGRIMFHMRFTGNQRLLQRAARSQQVFYGPSYKALHKQYGFTVS